ncbi:hypothetical protein C9374_005830 [Naegleria lovaniensis]|uniref:Uncharacterized protein n=1 Tax=Naegleria lovaniensis TaxID=51637 RepID=A0AA88KJN3_NAELO|nr:uncharacterized protein C9374_005830 [Naegleria lovaniensis]KAG2382038.1 hypothetical protein C9374_005830 [Naegleria lovaniensis]
MPQRQRFVFYGFPSHYRMMALLYGQDVSLFPTSVTTLVQASTNNLPSITQARYGYLNFMFHHCECFIPDLNGKRTGRAIKKLKVVGDVIAILISGEEWSDDEDTLMIVDLSHCSQSFKPGKISNLKEHSAELIPTHFNNLPQKNRKHVKQQYYIEEIVFSQKYGQIESIQCSSSNRMLIKTKFGEYYLGNVEKKNQNISCTFQPLKTNSLLTISRLSDTTRVQNVLLGEQFYCTYSNQEIYIYGKFTQGDSIVPKFFDGKMALPSLVSSIQNIQSDAYSLIVQAKNSGDYHWSNTCGSNLNHRNIQQLLYALLGKSSFLDYHVKRIFPNKSSSGYVAEMKHSKSGKYRYLIISNPSLCMEGHVSKCWRPQKIQKFFSTSSY